jgi:hypothetical protein
MVTAGPRRFAAVSLVLLVSACAGGPSITPSSAPSEQPSADASASAGPLPSPEPTVEPSSTTPPVAVETPFADPCQPLVPDNRASAINPLLPGSAVRVTVSELNLRAGPCTAADRIATLKKGALLLVADGETQCCIGPSRTNGYSWYTVVWLKGPNATLPALPADPRDPGTGAIVVGYIAANDGSTAFVKPLEPRCPATLDFENLHAMLPAERLACFDGPITVEGTFGCPECGGTGGFVGKPQWLMGAENVWNFSSTGLALHGPYLHFKPAGPAQPPQGSSIRATVHVNDPASANCVLALLGTEPQFVVPEQVGVAYCRERLVVDSYEILGTDPAF